MKITRDKAMKRSGIWLAYLGFILTVILGAGPSQAQPPKMRVAASILPLADFCRQIGGDKVEVQVLIPPGASPHTFEPSPGTLTGLAQAKVLVYIGGGLEPWIDKFLGSLKEKKPFVVEATHGIALIKEIPEHVRGSDSPGHRHPEKTDKVQEDQKEAPGHDHGAGNPHIWLNPILAQDICHQIAAAFIQVDSKNRAFYEQNLHTYLEKLSGLDKHLANQIAWFKIREFVSFHPSFTYFARRYNLKEVGVIEVAPGREPTPRAFQNIKKAIRHYNIKVIFAEPQFSPRIAEVLAKEAGVEVLFLDPIGGHPPYGDNYLKMMQFNVETMAKAMK